MHFPSQKEIKKSMLRLGQTYKANANDGYIVEEKFSAGHKKDARKIFGPREWPWTA